MIDCSRGTADFDCFLDWNIHCKSWQYSVTTNSVHHTCKLLLTICTLQTFGFAVWMKKWWELGFCAMYFRWYAHIKKWFDVHLYFYCSLFLYSLYQQLFWSCIIVIIRVLYHTITMDMKIWFNCERPVVQHSFCSPTLSPAFICLQVQWFNRCWCHIYMYRR